jgi:hypothetical protein
MYVKTSDLEIVKFAGSGLAVLTSKSNENVKKLLSLGCDELLERIFNNLKYNSMKLVFSGLIMLRNIVRYNEDYLTTFMDVQVLNNLLSKFKEGSIQFKKILLNLIKTFVY